MPPRDWRFRIEDMLESIDAVRSYVEDRTLESFEADRRTQRAVAYEIVVIGEAARHIPDDLRARYPALPWSQMTAVRNRAVHEYFRLSVPILWSIATSDLPALAVFLRAVLDDESSAVS